MKRILCLLLVSGLLSFSFINHPNPILPKKYAAKPSSSFTFERKGKTYTSTEVEGNIIMPETKKNIYFLLSTELKTDGKDIMLGIHFRNQDDLVTGKAYTLSGNGKLENDDKKPRTILYSEFVEGASDESKTIASGSESGTLTFSTITVSGQKAIISGKFEFKGKNDNDDPNAEKEITIKGSFSNLEIRYISSTMFKQ